MSIQFIRYLEDPFFMDKRQNEFQIRDLIEITKDKKYAATVAAFEIIENLDKLDLDPKKLGWKTNKVSVLAMLALARGKIKFDFVTDEQRLKLEEELKQSTNIYLQKAEAIFQKKKKLTENEEEDLSEEDIGELAEETFEETDEDAQEIEYEESEEDVEEEEEEEDQSDDEEDEEDSLEDEEDSD